MYDKYTFKNKVRKRNIEDILTTLKYPGGNALSLTGPYIEGHVDNYKQAGFSHVYIAECDRDTYMHMKVDPYLSKNKEYVTLKFGDVFSYFDELADDGITFSEIDLDFTKTIGTLLPMLNQNLPRVLTSDRFNDKFTLIFTFCHRQSRNTKEDLRELDILINSLDWCNITDIYYESYRDGSPMFTQLYCLEKSNNKQYINLTSRKKDITDNEMKIKKLGKENLYFTKDGAPLTEDVFIEQYIQEILTRLVPTFKFKLDVQKIYDKYSPGTLETYSIYINNVLLGNVKAKNLFKDEFRIREFKELMENCIKDKLLWTYDTETDLVTYE